MTLLCPFKTKIMVKSPAEDFQLLTSTFLDRVLSVFRRRLVLTTPAPHFEPMNDAAGTALRGLGKTIFTKYFERLREFSPYVFFIEDNSI